MSTSTKKTTTIRIPTPLRPQADGQSEVAVEGDTVGETLRNLAAKYPELEANLFNENGELRSFVNIYVGDEDIRYLQQEETPVEPGDELSIVPSVAGGR